MIAPTARHALGEPARSAISPYVATRPDGMRRTADSTRRWSCEMTFTMTVTLASDASRPSENSKTAEAFHAVLCPFDSAADDELHSEGRASKIGLVECRRHATSIRANRAGDARPLRLAGNAQQPVETELRSTQQVIARMPFVDILVVVGERGRLF